MAQKGGDNVPELVDLEKRDLPPYPTKTGQSKSAPLKLDKDADEALQAFEGLDGETLVIDEQTNRQLLRKIDWNMMPLMCVIYGLNYLDSERSSVVSAFEV